jgi:hypothetical protein
MTTFIIPSYFQDHTDKIRAAVADPYTVTDVEPLKNLSPSDMIVIQDTVADNVPTEVLEQVKAAELAGVYVLREI